MSKQKETDAEDMQDADEENEVKSKSKKEDEKEEDQDSDEETEDKGSDEDKDSSDEEEKEDKDDKDNKDEKDEKEDKEEKDEGEDEEDDDSEEDDKDKTSKTSDSKAKKPTSEKAHHELKKAKASASKDPTWMIVSIILGVLLLALLAYNIYASRNVQEQPSVNDAGANTVGAKAVEFINSNNMLPAGVKATLKESKKSQEYPFLYKLTLDIAGSPVETYITTDGNLLFPRMVYLNQTIAKPAAQPAQELRNYSSLDKVAKPKMTVWVESRCPFGVQAVNGLTSVQSLLGKSADIEVRYMVSKVSETEVSAMHGPEELAEDKREICIREQQGYPIYWKYMKCYVETGKTTDCEKTAKVDSEKLAACVENDAITLLLQDAEDWATIYRPNGGGGSPSFFLNDKSLDEFSFSANGRSPENLKQILCNSMEEPAKSCSTKLAAANPPRGFGTIEAGASTTADQASCG